LAFLLISYWPELSHVAIPSYKIASEQPFSLGSKGLGRKGSNLLLEKKEGMDTGKQ
jgi:hypothetical protein